MNSKLDPLSERRGLTASSYSLDGIDGRTTVEQFKHLVSSTSTYLDKAEALVRVVNQVVTQSGVQSPNTLTTT